MLPSLLPHCKFLATHLTQGVRPVSHPSGASSRTGIFVQSSPYEPEDPFSDVRWRTPHPPDPVLTSRNIARGRRQAARYTSLEPDFNENDSKSTRLLRQHVLGRYIHIVMYRYLIPLRWSPCRLFMLCFATRSLYYASLIYCRGEPIIQQTDRCLWHAHKQPRM